jgi:hypothetical protein
MDRYNFQFGCFWLSFNGSMINVGVDRDRLERYAREQKIKIPEARLRPGRRPDHLTVPLEPRRSGPDAGKYWIHLTYTDGPTPERIPLPGAVLHPDDLQAANMAIEQAMLNLPVFRESVRQTHLVDTAWLVEHRYALIVFETSAMLERFDVAFKRGSRRYVIPIDRLEREIERTAIEEALEIDPTILNDERFKADPPEPIIAIPYGDDAAEKSSLTINRFSRRGHLGEPGWYATPRDILDNAIKNANDEDFDDFARRFIRPGLLESIKTICFEFGLPVNIAALARLGAH